MPGTTWAAIHRPATPNRNRRIRPLSMASFHVEGVVAPAAMVEQMHDAPLLEQPPEMALGTVVVTAEARILHRQLDVRLGAMVEQGLGLAGDARAGRAFDHLDAVGPHHPADGDLTLGV